MKIYYCPEDVYVVRNRKTKKYKILEAWGNKIINPLRFTVYDSALLFVPCRTELRFYKVYGDITFLDRV